MITSKPVDLIKINLPHAAKSDQDWPLPIIFNFYVSDLVSVALSKHIRTPVKISQLFVVITSLTSGLVM